MRRLVFVLVGLGLISARPAAVAAPREDLTVVPSTASSDPALAARFPVSIDGQPLVVETWNGDEWVAHLDPDAPREAAAIAATESLVAGTGTPLDHVEVASASIDLSRGGGISVAAVRVPGSRAYDVVTAAVTTLLPDVGNPLLGWGWAGDRWIAYARTTADELAIVYPAGDTVWVVDAHASPDTSLVDLTEPIVAALPAQAGAIGPVAPPLLRVEFPSLGIAAAFPEEWMVETVPMSADEQAVIRRSTGRFGIDADWLGTVGAVGPLDPDLEAAPTCRLIVFVGSDLTPSAWISAVSEVDSCYLVDETSTGLVRARISPGTCGREWAPSQGGVEHFALGSGDEIAYLLCWTKEPPGERGSAIAESIEFLPE